MDDPSSAEFREWAAEMDARLERFKADFLAQAMKQPPERLTPELIAATPDDELELSIFRFASSGPTASSEDEKYTWLAELP